MNSALLAVLRRNKLVPAIAAWQASATRVHCGGLAAAAFADSSNVTGSTTGRTLISNPAFNKATSMRQDGCVRQAKAYIHGVGAANQRIKFKVFRPNGPDFDFVGESESFPLPGTGAQTFTLSQPIPCAVGDVFGCYITGDAVGVNQCALSVENVTANPALKYTAGDITATNAFSSTLGFNIDIEALSNPPYLCVTGDSIPEGRGADAPDYQSFYDAGPAGDLTHEVGHMLRTVVANGSLLQYQNHAKGSQTFAWVRSTGVVSALAVGPKAILIHCGVNDLSLGRTWQNVSDDLDAIKALAGTTRLYIDELFPWNNGSDAQAATLRTWNANLAAWCGVNGAVLIHCHDAMGQTRAGTGQLDDLITAYNSGDGVHPSRAGVAAWARIIRPYLR